MITVEDDPGTESETCNATSSHTCFEHQPSWIPVNTSNNSLLHTQVPVEAAQMSLRPGNRRGYHKSKEAAGRQRLLRASDRQICMCKSQPFADTSESNEFQCRPPAGQPVVELVSAHMNSGDKLLRGRDVQEREQGTSQVFCLACKIVFLVPTSCGSSCVGVG